MSVSSPVPQAYTRTADSNHWWINHWSTTPICVGRGTCLKWGLPYCSFFFSVKFVRSTMSCLYPMTFRGNLWQSHLTYRRPVICSCSWTTMPLDTRANSIQGTTQGSESGVHSDERTPADPRYSEPANHCSYHNSFNHDSVSVYYRVYTTNGARPSAKPIYSDNPFLGRVLARRVAPPHKARSVKRCLLSCENVKENTPTKLFASASDEIPINDTSPVSIMAYPGPGCTPEDPMALVIKNPVAARSSLETVYIQHTEGPTPFATRYCKCYDASNCSR